MASRAKKHADTPQSPVIECGGVRFSKDRVELTRNEKRMSSFARNDTRWIRIGRDSASEQPLTEFLWALGFANGAFFVFKTDAPGKTGHLAGGLALSLLAAVLIVHMVRRVTTLTIQLAHGVVSIRVGVELSAEEMADLNARLRDELGWPVKT